MKMNEEKSVLNLSNELDKIVCELSQKEYPQNIFAAQSGRFIATIGTFPNTPENREHLNEMIQVMASTLKAVQNG